MQTDNAFTRQAKSIYKKPKTLVRFLVHKIDGEVFAMFPQLNFNKKLYGTRSKVCYAHIGQHSCCSNDIHTPDSDNPWIMATQDPYEPLQKELESIGYHLRVLNEMYPQSKAFYKAHSHNGYTFSSIDKRCITYSRKETEGYSVIKFWPIDFFNDNFEEMADKNLSRK